MRDKMDTISCLPSLVESSSLVNSFAASLGASLSNDQNLAMQTNAVCTLANLGHESIKMEILNFPGVLKYLVKFVNQDQNFVLAGQAVRAIGNLAATEDSTMQVKIACSLNLLESLGVSLSKSQNPVLQRDAAVALANLALANEESIREEILDLPGLRENLEGDHDVQVVVARLFANLACTKDDAIRCRLVHLCGDRLAYCFVQQESRELQMEAARAFANLTFMTDETLRKGITQVPVILDALAKSLAHDESPNFQARGGSACEENDKNAFINFQDEICNLQVDAARVLTNWAISKDNSFKGEIFHSPGMLVWASMSQRKPKTPGWTPYSERNLRSDIKLLGLATWEEQYNSQRMCALYDVRKDQRGIDFMFFHAEAMASLFGTGLQHAIVSVIHNPELEIVIKEIECKDWEDVWLDAYRGCFKPMIFWRLEESSWDSGDHDKSALNLVTLSDFKRGDVESAISFELLYRRWIGDLIQYLQHGGDTENIYCERDSVTVEEGDLSGIEDDLGLQRLLEGDLSDGTRHDEDDNTKNHVGNNHGDGSDNGRSVGNGIAHCGDNGDSGDGQSESGVNENGQDGSSGGVHNGGSGNDQGNGSQDAHSGVNGDAEHGGSGKSQGDGNGNGQGGGGNGNSQGGGGNGNGQGGGGNGNAQGGGDENAQGVDNGNIQSGGGNGNDGSGDPNKPQNDQSSGKVVVNVQLKRKSAFYKTYENGVKDEVQVQATDETFSLIRENSKIVPDLKIELLWISRFQRKVCVDFRVQYNISNTHTERFGWYQNDLQLSFACEESEASQKVIKVDEKIISEMRDVSIQTTEKSGRSTSNSRSNVMSGLMGLNFPPASVNFQLGRGNKVGETAEKGVEDLWQISHPCLAQRPTFVVISTSKENDLSYKASYLFNIEPTRHWEDKRWIEVSPTGLYANLTLSVGGEWEFITDHDDEQVKFKFEATKKLSKCTNPAESSGGMQVKSKSKFQPLKNLTSWTKRPSSTVQFQASPGDTKLDQAWQGLTRELVFDHNFEKFFGKLKSTESYRIRDPIGEESIHVIVEVMAQCYNRLRSTQSC